MEFVYFKGLMEDMGDLFMGRKICAICHEENDYCFALEYTISSIFEYKDQKGTFGCFKCLRDSKFEFWHSTELGFLDENGLMNTNTRKIYDPPIISEEKLVELRRTPQIITYQEEKWLTHCNDFMVFKGIWTPPDFYKNSPDGDGKTLFLAMTDDNIAHLWEESLPEGQEALEEWYPTYYVFECRHCNKLRGNWDCD